ncbi:hypothetical protein GOC76_23775 [Sinorhizobium medicae]|nr:hypothetical protein [Sinorhizobium medicae]
MGTVVQFNRRSGVTFNIDRAALRRAFLDGPDVIDRTVALLLAARASLDGRRLTERELRSLGVFDLLRLGFQLRRAFDEGNHHHGQQA